MLLTLAVPWPLAVGSIDTRPTGLVTCHKKISGPSNVNKFGFHDASLLTGVTLNRIINRSFGISPAGTAIFGRVIRFKPIPVKSVCTSYEAEAS